MNISDLLHDAVDEVEPADRINEIRTRAASSQRAAARPWFYAAGGVVLATAAAVTAFAVLGNDAPPDSRHDHHMATEPMDTQVVAAYFIGDTPAGPRLYREFDTVPAGDPLQAALDRIQRPASDPDYTTPWSHGSFGNVTMDEDSIDVELNLNQQMGDLAVQQVVYTLQAAAGTQLPVWFWLDGQRGNAPHEAVPQTEVLSQMSISDPAEGYSYSGSMIARGRANSPDGQVRWELQDEDHVVVAEGSTTAEGSGDRLYWWEAEVDLTDVPFGFYTFVAFTDDPPGGFGPFTDTRLITVR